MLYRSDLFATWELTPPTTWEEYRATVITIRQRLPQTPASELRFATLEPLGDGWAARLLLARAAAYAPHPNQYSSLFQFTTMKPWIDQPPFLRALEELIGDVGPLPAAMQTLSPDDVMEQLLTGQTAMAITWPSAARTTKLKLVSPAAFGILPLPGAREVYQMSDGIWQPRGTDVSPRVPLLGVAGRIGAIARRARLPQAAKGFLQWVTRADSSIRISTASTATTLFRMVQTAQPQAWVEPALASVAGQFAAAMVENQRPATVLMMPRLPGQADYLRELDQAVRDAVRGQTDAPEARRQVAQAWAQITSERGSATQRTAYEASLGL